MKNIYFLSDLHLGARTIADPRAHEKRVVRWLDSIKSEASAIYLMGDILDFWFEYKTVIPRGYTRFLGKLAELSDMGIDMHWFTGNHDIWIFDYIPDELGVTVHHGPEIVTLGGKTFFLAHGDGMDNPPPVFRIIRAVFYNKLCQRLFSGIHPRWSVSFAHRWSSQSRKKGERYASYQGEQEEYLAVFARKFLQEHSIDYFIFGHRHIMLDLKLTPESRIIILGDWIHHFSFAVFDGKEIWLDRYEEETTTSV